MEKGFGTTRAMRGGAWALIAIPAVLGLLYLGACAPMMALMHGRVERPAASEFGFGPRQSARGLYVATIEPTETLRVRRMHRLRLTLRAADQAPVEDVSITIDGGMPEHGHGLPTKPRVTGNPGPGVYQIDGLKFNMGGWWELRFRIASAAGTDSVTFNLEL
jgi:hypothetical protein